MIRAARVTRDGITRAAPLDLWAGAMIGLVEEPPKTLTLPLAGNGYLLKIVASGAERAAAKAEEKIEQKRRSGENRATAEPAVAKREARTDPVKSKEHLKKLRADLEKSRAERDG